MTGGFGGGTEIELLGLIEVGVGVVVVVLEDELVVLEDELEVVILEEDGVGVGVGLLHTVRLQGMVEMVVLKMVSVVVFSCELVVQMLEVVLVTTLVMRRYSAS